jgi:uncharacterized membrane protein
MIDVNYFLSFQVHGTAGGHKAGDGIAGNVAEFLTFLESLVGLTASEMFSIILPGTASMANIHPLLVHFPIAFLVAFFIVDLTGSLLRNDNWRQLAGGLLYLGTIFAGAAVAAGLMAEATVEHGENVHLILERHKFIGISVLCISVLLSIWRLLSGGIIKGVANGLYLLFAIVLNILIILGADLGGLMVYKYGVAVEAVEVRAMDYFLEHTHSH